MYTTSFLLWRKLGTRFKFLFRLCGWSIPLVLELSRDSLRSRTKVSWSMVRERFELIDSLSQSVSDSSTMIIQVNPVPTRSSKAVFFSSVRVLKFEWCVSPRSGRVGVRSRLRMSQWLPIGATAGGFQRRLFVCLFVFFFFCSASYLIGVREISSSNSLRYNNHHWHLTRLPSASLDSFLLNWIEYVISIGRCGCVGCDRIYVSNLIFYLKTWLELLENCQTSRRAIM